MHMADALVSPLVGAAGWVVALGVAGQAGRAMGRDPEAVPVPLLGVSAAFVFAAQMINFAIPGTGSSGHLGGGLLLATLLGPAAAFLSMFSILVVQALAFADGGLLALGCNVVNLGLFPCFVAYPLVFRPLAGAAPTRRRLTLAAVVAAVVGLQLGALGVVLETRLSGLAALPTVPFLLLMQPIHLAIGVVEGLATAAVIVAVGAARPELLDTARRSSILTRRHVAGLAVAALILAVVVSWFASSAPDGLEWSLARLAGEVDPGVEEAWPAVEAGTSLAGAVGGLLTVILAGLVGLGVRRASALRR